MNVAPKKELGQLIESVDFKESDLVEFDQKLFISEGKAVLPNNNDDIPLRTSHSMKISKEDIEDILPPEETKVQKKVKPDLSDPT